MKKLKGFFGFLKVVFMEWSEDHASRWAAALSLYVLLALGPIMVLLVAFVGRIVGQSQARQVIIDHTQSLMGSAGATAIQSVLGNAHENASSPAQLVLGFAVLVLSVTGLILSLQAALNTMWEIEWKPGQGIKGFLRKRLASLIALVGLLLIFLAVVVASEFLNGYVNTILDSGGVVWSRLGSGLITWGIFTVLFAFIFRAVPQAKIDWRSIWIGSVFTSTLFMVGKVGLGFYLGRSSTASYFGSAGFLVVFILFVYYFGQIFFLGAEFTQVWANRYGRGITPEEHTQHIPERPGEYRGGEGAQAVRPPDEEFQPESGRNEPDGGPGPDTKQPSGYTTALEHSDEGPEKKA